MADDALSVKTYSGLSYPERPLSFHWHGAEHDVTTIEKSWLEPGERHFRVMTDDGRRFHLWYEEAMDRWRAAEE